MNFSGKASCIENWKAQDRGLDHGTSHLKLARSAMMVAMVMISRFGLEPLVKDLREKVNDEPWQSSFFIVIHNKWIY